METSDPLMPSGTGLGIFNDVDSTNAEALRAMENGQVAPHWFMAKSQNSGRGRQGRIWISEAGNLYASLLLPVTCKPEDIPQLSFVAALGVHDGVSAMMGKREGQRKLTLKWPNDVLLDGKKLAGILLETSSTGAKIKMAVIGIGLNLAHCPEIQGKPATCLAEHGINITPAKALSYLASAFEHRLQDWGQGQNFDLIRDDWLSQADGIGAQYELASQMDNLCGVFETIDLDGALVLRMQNGALHRVTSGEIRRAGGAEL